MPRWFWEILIGGGLFYSVVSLLLNPDRLYRVIAAVYRFLDRVLPGFIGERLKYGKAAKQTETRINSTCAQMEENEVQDIFTHPVSIQWVRTKEEAEEHLSKGKGLVKMEYKDDPAGNFINATLQYLEKSMLPGVRPCLNPHLRKATKYTVAQRIFRDQKDLHALPTFFEEEYEPAKKKEPKIEEHFHNLSRADKAGIFTRIFLNELKGFSGKLRNDEIFLSDDIKGKLDRFSKEYIADLAKKIQGPTGKQVNLNFREGQFMLATLLFIKPSTEKFKGLSAHKWRLNKLIREGTEKIYLLGTNKNASGEFDDRFIGLTRQFANISEKKGKLEIIEEHTYSFQDQEGDRVEAVCIETRIPPNAPAEPSYAKTIKKALGYEIPEFANGRIDVEGVVRIPNHTIKVAIKASDSDVNPVSACVGEDGSKIKAISDRIDYQENITIVEWSEDKKEYLTNALNNTEWGRSPRAVISKIDIGDSRATVYIKDKAAIKNIIGSEGSNVKSASRLVGLINVNVELDS